MCGSSVSLFLFCCAALQGVRHLVQSQNNASLPNTLVSMVLVLNSNLLLFCVPAHMFLIAKCPCLILQYIVPFGSSALELPVYHCDFLLPLDGSNKLWFVEHFLKPKDSSLLFGSCVVCVAMLAKCATCKIQDRNQQTGSLFGGISWRLTLNLNLGNLDVQRLELYFGLFPSQY